MIQRTTKSIHNLVLENPWMAWSINSFCGFKKCLIESADIIIATVIILNMNNESEIWKFNILSNFFRNNMSINMPNKLHNKYSGITDFNLLSFSLTDNPTKSLIKNGVKLNPNN
jgi:hypothetical protein